jgi:DNA-directed RNA polymerase subunit M/transcription elongation factor TFIIS
MAKTCPKCNSKFYKEQESAEYQRRVGQRVLANFLTLGLAAALPGRPSLKGNLLYTCQQCHHTWTN